MAIDFQKKGTDKDRETAATLMNDAKALTNEYPEDEDELDGLMEIVKGYATTNPIEAFRIFEPIVEQMNDVAQATAILSKYSKRNPDFKKGELIMKINGSRWTDFLPYKYIKQIKMFSNADLNRMIVLSDKFQRSDARTIVKLFVAQGLFEQGR